MRVVDSVPSKPSLSIFNFFGLKLINDLSLSLTLVKRLLFSVDNLQLESNTYDFLAVVPNTFKNIYIKKMVDFENNKQMRIL